MVQQVGDHKMEAPDAWQIKCDKIDDMVTEWNDKSLDAWKIKCHLCSQTLDDISYKTDRHMSLVELKRNDIVIPKEPICGNCVSVLETWGDTYECIIWFSNQCCWCDSYYITENRYDGKYPRCTHCLWHDKVRILSTTLLWKYKYVLDAVNSMMVEYIPDMDAISVIHEYTGRFRMPIPIPGKNYKRIDMLKRYGYSQHPHPDGCIIL